MKKAIVVFWFFLMLLYGLSSAESFNVLFVTDVGGLGDGNLNDGCWLGVQRAAKEFNIKAKVIQSFRQEDYLANISDGAKQGDIVMVAGLLMSDVVAKAALMYPKSQFVLIDALIDAPNVKCVLFKEEEGGFWAGLVAAAVTGSGKVGYVVGMKTSQAMRFVFGYEAGVRGYSILKGKDVKVLGAYVGTLNDAGKGKEVSLSLFNQGVDVVFQIAGRSGSGVIEAAKERGGRSFVIGVDLDPELMGSGNVLASISRKVDVAAYLSLKDIFNGGFKGGVSRLGLREGGFDLVETKILRGFLSQEDLDLIERLKGLVIDGVLVVPSSEEELAKFVPPKSL